MREIANELRRSLAGSVVGPDDPGYDAARRCFNALVDRRPALIARCVGADDVASAFELARAHGLDVAVRGGGHNPAGHCVCDGGLVIDLSSIRRVEVDADARIARAEGGATWLDFDSATQAFGLAAPGGIVGSTGVAGLTFGGGIGHLTAQHGLSCDNLVGAEVVTPNGAVIHASPDGDADLLWALRGGGGNFGVATRLDFRLHPLDGVVGGRLTYRGTGVREALRRFRDVAARAPRDLSVQASILLDESLDPSVTILPCYTGPRGDPEVLRALRSAPGLVDDGLRAHTFLDQQRLSDPPYGEDRIYWKGHFVRELPDELIDELLGRIGPRPPARRDPARVPARCAEGRRRDRRRARLSQRRFQHQRHGGLAGRPPRRGADRVGARHSGRDRALVLQRRLRQLHAGRRADRARAGRVRRRGLRAAAGPEEHVRPEQRAAPQPEHPTAGPASGGIDTAWRCPMWHGRNDL